ncbi:hypothetical protein [Compostibacter hankyongensis]|uniref:hypothetical protein n=1 Tax=Compostibacter hankyongensis TaxID=1007089 RepID=UPI0031EA8510
MAVRFAPFIFIPISLVKQACHAKPWDYPHFVRVIPVACGGRAKAQKSRRCAPSIFIFIRVAK